MLINYMISSAISKIIELTYENWMSEDIRLEIIPNIKNYIKEIKELLEKGASTRLFGEKIY